MEKIIDFINFNMLCEGGNYIDYQDTNGEDIERTFRIPQNENCDE